MTLSAPFALSLLVPTAADLLGWTGVIFAALVLIGFGRLLSRGRAAPEAALLAGWGGAAIVLTLWGIATPTALRWPAIAIAALGSLALVLPGSRLRAAEWLALGRVVVMALPLLAVLASARPSEPDTFLNLLPNAAYLYDHQMFPADDRPPAHSFIAGAPYNMQLAAFIAALVTPDFPSSAMIGINILLQLAAGLLLARVLGRSEDDPARAPSWALTALGLLLATALNPGFVPRYHLSAYSEPSVTVALAFAGWFGARALQRTSSGRPAANELWLLALTLAALVNIKQESPAMVAGILAAVGLLAIIENRRLWPLLGVALAAAPAIALYLAWRWYVLRHFALGELKLMPMSAWELDKLPQVLAGVVHYVVNKGFYFGALAATFVAGGLHLRRHGLDLAGRSVALLGGAFIVYNAALFLAYVGHFPGSMGASAHSYFRYNTHLSLLMMLALVLVARDRWGDRARLPEGRWQTAVGTLLVLAMLLAPLVFLRILRFDLEEPQLRAWTLAQRVAAAVGDRDRLGLLLPGDDSSLATVLEGLLRDTAPRRKDLDVLALPSAGPGAFATLEAKGYALAVLSCAPPGIADVPAGTAALLQRGPSGWHPVAIWPYDPPPAGAHWAHNLEAGLCF